MRASDTLTEKQRKFVEAYLASGNATQAYQQAGYQGNANVAAVESHKILRNPKMQQALAARRAQLATASDVTPERVMAELALIGFSDLHAYVTWGPGGVTLRDSTQLDAAARRVVSDVSQTITKDGSTIRFKLHSKVEALEKLGTHLGLWQTPTVTTTLEWLQTVQEGRDRLQAQLATLAQKAQTNGHSATADDTVPGA